MTTSTSGRFVFFPLFSLSGEDGDSQQVDKDKEAAVVVS
jgi:hypothetical protein